MVLRLVTPARAVAARQGVSLLKITLHYLAEA
jgi:hypothetical protein